MSADKEPRTPDSLHGMMEDTPLAEKAATKMLRTFRWSAGHGWLNYDGKVWRTVPEERTFETVRTLLRDWYLGILDDGASPNVAKMYAGLLGKNKVGTVTTLLRGILEVDPDELDAQPDLLNVQNGVVDLRTGKLHLHSPLYMMTKIANGNYRPDTTHEDWTQALEAFADTEVEGWMQVRIGQAATGYMTSDDVMPILQGGGSNGKSTITAAIMAALGTHAAMVPEKLLLADPSAHPTELTTLQGVRLALIEELPEGNHLNTKRLKDALGTPTITARKMRQDFVTWRATHSLMLTTNYKPSVSETDHSVWRRLALVTFPITYRGPEEPLNRVTDRRGDPSLRDRLGHNTDGQWDAVLTWIVDGAKYWYDSGKEQLDTPKQVKDDTREWRGASDLILAYVEERLEFDPAAVTRTATVYEDFTRWLFNNGNSPWSEKLFAARFEAHDSVKDHHVGKTKARLPVPVGQNMIMEPVTPAGPVAVWTGVRFAA